jgi:hypothetical protein
MKPLHTVRLMVLALSVGIFSCSSSKYASTGTSEYDDLYFNQGDRYPVMTNGTTTVVQTLDSDGGVGVGYNSKTLNPDYGLPQDALAENDYAQDEYYVEDYDQEYLDQAIDNYLRNNSTAQRNVSPRYYRNFDDVFWTDPFYYQGTIFDPLYRSYYGVYNPFAYGAFYRPYSSFYRPWGPGLSVSIGFGFGFGPYWNRYYDPFFYGGGFGYGYGYYGSINRYYGNAWCPPSYYGGFNNTVVINNIESTNPGNVRYGTRQSRGGSYIVDNSPRARSTSDAATINQRSIRSGASRSVNNATQRTVSTDSRVIDRSRSSNIRSRNVDGINQMNNRIDRANSRFRTHSLDSRTNSGLNDRRTNSSLNRRRSVEQGVYNNPSRNSINRSIDRGNSSRTSGSGQYKPNRSSSSDAIRNRGNYSRSSTPSRSPGRSNFSSPSRSNNFSSPSRSNYSSPSRSNSYSPSRSSSPAPNRSSSIPSRPSRARSVR